MKAAKVEEKTEETPEPKVSETEVKITETMKSEIEIDRTSPKPVPEQPTPQENQAFAPVTTAIQLPRSDDVTTPVAPQQTVYTEDDSDRIPEWRRQVSNKLERNKRYPASAKSRGERGTTYIEFKLDREGRVIESRVVRSSGSAALDHETLDLLHRADPFPKPPVATLNGATVVLSYPLVFNMR
jgi:protein TonB